MSKPLGNDQIKEQLQKLEFNWKVSGTKLHIELETKDFAEALWVVSEVGQAAEELNHHPDISLHDYMHVDITTTTHSADGLTANDFALAEKIDAIITRLK